MQKSFDYFALSPEQVDWIEILLQRHRLVRRAAARLDDDASSSLFAGMIARALRAEDQLIEREAATIAELLRSPARLGQTVIQIKGNSVARHVREGVLHGSWDIDLLASDPSRLRNSLEALTWTTTTGAVPHEFASATRSGSLPIDLHRYFPSWRYTPRAERVVRGASPSPTRTEDLLIFGQITFADLLPYTETHKFWNSELWRVPSREAAATIHCLHLLKDYVEAPGASRFDKVRLGDLLDIVKLFAAPDFDPAVFAELVAKWGAFDSVNFVGNQLKAYGLHIPAWVDSYVTGRAFPNELIRGVLVPGVSHDSLEIRTAESGTSALKWLKEHWNSEVLSGQSPIAGVQKASGKLEAVAEIGPASTVIRVRTPGHGSYYKDEVGLYFGSNMSRIQRTVDSGAVLVRPPYNDVSVSWKDVTGRSEVTFRLPTRMFSVEGVAEVLVESHRFLKQPDSDWSNFLHVSLQTHVVLLQLDSPVLASSAA